jgi:hypothetical protein
MQQDIRNLSDLSYVTTIVDAENMGSPHGMYVDDTYFYTCNELTVVKYNKTTFEYVGEYGDRTGDTWDAPTGFSFAYGIAGDVNYLYVLDQNDALRIVRINKATMAYVDEYRDEEWSVWGNPESLAVDDTYIYGVSDSGEGLVRINKSTMAFADVIYPPTQDYPIQVFIEGTDLYITEYYDDGVKKYNLSNTTLTSQSPSSDGDPNFWLDAPTAIDCDENYLYVMNRDYSIDGGWSQGEVKIYSKPDITYVDRKQFPNIYVEGMAVDDSYIYMMEYINPNSYLRKRLKYPPYTQVDTVTDSTASVIDVNYDIPDVTSEISEYSSSLIASDFTPSPQNAYSLGVRMVGYEETLFGCIMAGVDVTPYGYPYNDAIYFTKGTINPYTYQPTWSNGAIIADVDYNTYNPDFEYPSLCAVSDTVVLGTVEVRNRTAPVAESYGLRVFVSMDGGANFTWSNPSGAVGDIRKSSPSYGPVIWGNSASTFYVFTDALVPDGGGNKWQIRYWKTTNGGSDYTLYTLKDNDYIWRCSADGLSDNDVMIAGVYTAPITYDYGIKVFHTHDGGSNWTESIVVSAGTMIDGTVRQWIMPCLKWVDENTVYCTARAGGSGYTVFAFFKSTDGGHTWSYHSNIIELDEWYETEGNCGIDIVSGTGGRIIWASNYESSYDNDHVGISIYKSIDSGNTWSRESILRNWYPSEDPDDDWNISPYTNEVYAYNQYACYIGIDDYDNLGTVFGQEDEWGSSFTWLGHAPFA